MVFNSEKLSFFFQIYSRNENSSNETLPVSISFYGQTDWHYFFFCRKLVTITAERLSDSSRITFTIPCDKKIKDLRSLLNHHLPPCLPDKFDLYSFQRGAQIHYHPPSFRLDYFPVIFDQSVLSLKMDDRIVNIPRNENTISTPQRCLTLLKSHFRRFSRTLRQFVHSQNTTVEKKSVIFSVS